MTEPTYADPYTRIAWLHEQLAAAEVREAQLREALERIAEGNLGPNAWQANYATVQKIARAALVVQPPDTREPEEVNEPDAERVSPRGSPQNASGSLTFPAGGAPGGVAKEDE